MKIINYIKIDNLITVNDLDKLVSVCYQNIDAIEINFATLLRYLDAKLRITDGALCFDDTIYNFTRFFSNLFENDFWKSKIDIKTPEIVNHIYDILVQNGSESPFIEKCYFYSIPIFINDFFDYKDFLFVFDTSEWVNFDIQLKKIINKDYYPTYFKLYNQKAVGQENLASHRDYARFLTDLKTYSFRLIADEGEILISMFDIDKVNSYLKLQKSKNYKYLYETDHDLTIYSEASLNYFYEDLIG